MKKELLYSHYLAPIFAIALSACIQAEVPTYEPDKNTSTPIPTPSATPSVTETTHAFTETPNKPQEITIRVGGDVMLGRYVLSQSLEHGSLAWPFENIDLASADITIINLENPLTSDCVQDDPYTWIFCAPVESAQAIADSGTDVAVTANNHYLDQKAAGYLETLKALKETGILPSDENHLAIIEKGDVRIGVIGINRISQTSEYAILTPEEIAKKIQSARERVDILIVYLHDGNEYFQIQNNDQELISQVAIDAGADVVVGTHPHVVQPITEYKGKPIFYSLGNLIFDQKGLNPNTGLVIDIKIEGNRIIGYHPRQINIINGQPEFTD